MKSTRNIKPNCMAVLLSLLALALGAARSSQAASLGLAEKDLAIAIPHSMPGLIGARSNLDSGEALFPRPWYDAVLKAYTSTSIADAVERENSFQDWKLIALRVVPCEPLGAVPDQNIDRLCWPELRLVWQPVIPDYMRFGRRVEAYSDDRAVHAGYRVLPDAVLNSQEAAEATALLLKADQGREQSPPQLKPLSDAELDKLGRLRTRIVNALLQDILSLRSSSLPASTYQGHGLRPETLQGPAEQSAFLGRLLGFLSRYAQPGRLQGLTSFSLPEGRDPAQLDEWVFVAFKASPRGLVQAPITLHSARDGRALGPGQMSQRASVNADDEGFAAEFFSSSAWQEAQQQLFLDAERSTAKRTLISDRRRTLIRNTSCASCHKMNGNLFDFHNFGFLEDAELTISPRVIRDVELDLAWIRNYL